MSDRHARKILFVCSRNKIRSLTAEKIFHGRPGLSVRSAGTQESARIQVTEGHIQWADTIVCMERSHANKLWNRFPEPLGEKEVLCLNIPDEFTYMQDELIDELEAAMAEHLGLPDR